jgi:phage baseplate assembly protein gpV
MPFSLIASKGRHMEASSFGQFWWTNQDSSTFAMINGAYAPNYSAGELSAYGKLFYHLSPSASAALLVSSCGPRSASGIFPGPQRCKPVVWAGPAPGGGVQMFTTCFDSAGNDVSRDRCFNAAYASTQTVVVGSGDGVATAELTPGAAGVTASTNDSNAPSDTVDNSVYTRWSGVGDGAWIKYDLGASRLIRDVQVGVFQGNWRWNHFDLQVSDDAASWTTVATYLTGSGTTTNEENYDVPDVRGRYVRYVGHGATLRPGAPPVGHPPPRYPARHHALEQSHRGQHLRSTVDRRRAEEQSDDGFRATRVVATDASNRKREPRRARRPSSCSGIDTSTPTAVCSSSSTTGVRPGPAGCAESRPREPRWPRAAPPAPRS